MCSPIRLRIIHRSNAMVRWPSRSSAANPRRCEGAPAPARHRGGGDGNRIRFHASGPQALQVEVDGSNLLYVYALTPARPTPQGPGVRVFRSGAVHEAG